MASQAYFIFSLLQRVLESDEIHVASYSYDVDKEEWCEVLLKVSKPPFSWTPENYGVWGGGEGFLPSSLSQLLSKREKRELLRQDPANTVLSEHFCSGMNPIQGAVNWKLIVSIFV